MKKDNEDRRRRMQKLLAVALSTTEPGEAHGAMQALRRVLEADGKDVHWLLSRLKLDAPKAPFVFGRMTQPDTPGWLDQMAYLEEDLSLLVLNGRELEFVISLRKQERSRERFSPSGRQLQWLESIYHRVKAFSSLTP